MIVNSATSYSPALCATDSAVCLGEQNWFAVYTRSRHEKMVADHLSRKRVQHLLPLYRTVHRWKTRPTEVCLPLFPSYVFVCTSAEQSLQVLRTPGVVRFVGVAGRPLPIRQSEIEAIQIAIRANLGVRPQGHLAVGARVQIRSGPLQGLEGVLIRKPGSLRLVLSISLISRCISVEVRDCDVAPSLAERFITHPSPEARYGYHATS
jgi:transcription antitermination factor NusG